MLLTAKKALYVRHVRRGGWLLSGARIVRSTVVQATYRVIPVCVRVPVSDRSPVLLCFKTHITISSQSTYRNIQAKSNSQDTRLGRWNITKKCKNYRRLK
jgi:hypothetical protein